MTVLGPSTRGELLTSFPLGLKGVLEASYAPLVFSHDYIVFPL